MVRLVHPFPVAVVLVTFICLALIATDHRLQPVELVRVAAVVLLTQIPVGALNDYVDREADAQTQPDKPIPAGVVSPRAALIMTVVSLLALVPAALSFGPISLLLVATGTAGGLAYDLWLKPTPASFLCYLVGFLSLFTWVWFVVGHITLWFLFVYPAGALLLVAAHMAQSFPDIESDRALGQRGLAAVLGPERTFRLMLLLVGAVEVGGIALAIVSRLPLALALVGMSLAVALPATRLRAAALRGRAARTLVFRLLAPAIAILALGCVLALRALS